MYKATTYHCKITHHPNARRRGQSQVYTGDKDRRGKEEYESVHSNYYHWFDTYNDAKNWMVAYFESRKNAAFSRYEEASRDLEKAMSL